MEKAWVAVPADASTFNSPSMSFLMGRKNYGYAPVFWILLYLLIKQTRAENSILIPLASRACSMLMVISWRRWILLHRDELWMIEGWLSYPQLIFSLARATNNLALLPQVSPMHWLCSSWLPPVHRNKDTSLTSSRMEDAASGASYVHHILKQVTP
jgi:hypothetical protein